MRIRAIPQRLHSTARRKRKKSRLASRRLQQLTTGTRSISLRMDMSKILRRQCDLLERRSGLLQFPSQRLKYEAMRGSLETTHPAPTALLCPLDGNMNLIPSQCSSMNTSTIDQTIGLTALPSYLAVQSEKIYSESLDIRALPLPTP